MKKRNDKHQANDFLDYYAKGRKTLFAWILDAVRVEAKHRALFSLYRDHDAGF